MRVRTWPFIPAALPNTWNTGYAAWQRNTAASDPTGGLMPNNSQSMWRLLALTPATDGGKDSNLFSVVGLAEPFWIRVAFWNVYWSSPPMVGNAPANGTWTPWEQRMFDSGNILISANYYGGGGSVYYRVEVKQ